MTTRILSNCRIYTFNPSQPAAQALAIRAGRIIMVGSHDEVLSLAGRDTPVEDLAGQVVLPAFSDAHIHLLEYGLSLQRVDCETSTREECLQRISRRAGTAAPGKWILGHGWNHNIWPDGIGDRHQLDAIRSDCPIYLTHKSLHSAWANSAALELAGINEPSNDPEGGQFQRDEHGQLTGILLESAMRVVEAVIPTPNPSVRMDALLQAQQALLEFGITSVHDFDSWECYTALQALRVNRQLKLRIMKGIPLPKLDDAIQEGLKSGQGDDHLSIGWLKLFADGALGPQTAAMLEPYEDSSSTGMLFTTAAEIVEIGEKALSHNISPAAHAIGDRANREVLDGFASLFDAGLLQEGPLPARIEHVQLITPSDIDRLAQFGITASMQPIHAISDRRMADKYWGGRCRNAYAWQSVKAGGAELIFGSDTPVESPNPLWGLFAAVTRRPLSAGGKPQSWQPHQCLSRTDALNAYITQPQVAAGKGDRLGKIQAGYIADLVILPEDPFSIAADEILDLLPCATMSDGEWIFRR